ncbi:Pectinesterase [Bertholletia excelsa]
MAAGNLSLSLLFLLSLSCHIPLSTATKSPERHAHQNLLRVFCVNATFPHICLRSLSSRAATATSPRALAEAAVDVSLFRARKTSRYLAAIRGRSGEERAALRDCIEQVSDSMDELRRTLAELRRLRRGTFRRQMSDVETWVSAALTNEDTCLDGFEEVGVKVRFSVKRRVRNVARVTSNALYLINRLDQTSQGLAGSDL